MPCVQLIHRNYLSMNSVLDIILTDVDEEAGELACSEISILAAKTEKILSRFDPEAEVYKLNKNALSHHFIVSSTLLDILVECQRFHKITQGYFDIGLGMFKCRENTISQNGAFVGMESVEINESNRSVKFWSENTSIDFGGIGKGILLREAAEILKRFNISNCFVSFGGSSILTRGSHPYGNGWPLSLREMANTDLTFRLSNHAVSISESHQNQNNTAHIINPKNYQLATYKRISFVQTSCPVLAEVLSTTLIIAPASEVREIIGIENVSKAIIFKNDQLNLSIEYQYGI